MKVSAYISMGISLFIVIPLFFTRILLGVFDYLTWVGLIFLFFLIPFMIVARSTKKDIENIEFQLAGYKETAKTKK
jgi:hypothetical protein